MILHLSAQVCPFGVSHWSLHSSAQTDDLYFSILEFPAVVVPSTHSRPLLMACQCHCHSLSLSLCCRHLLYSCHQNRSKRLHPNITIPIRAFRSRSIQSSIALTYLLALHLSRTSLDTISRSRSFFRSLVVSQFVAPRETSTFFSWSLIGENKLFHLFFPSSILQRSLL